MIKDIDSAPAFSPDGQEFAFVRGILNPGGNQIVVAKADGSGERVLVDRRGFGAGTARVAWSADGKMLAMISPEVREGGNRWVLEVVSRSTGAVRDLHTFIAPTLALDWLPDNSGLLVAGIDPQRSRGQISFVSYPNGETGRFTNDLINYDSCCLAVTRDGDALVALQNAAFSDVWVATGDGADARQVSSGEALGLGLDWIGNRIVAQTSLLQWSVLNPDGSNKVPLLNDGNLHFQLSACNDGKHIVYDSWHEGSPSLWRSDADGSSPVRFPVTTVLQGTQCMPDSKSAMYATDKGLWSVAIEGGTPVKLDVPLALAGYSPDGKFIFYVSNRVEGGALRFQLVVVPATGGKPLYTFDAPYGMRSAKFTPDSKALAFLLSRNHATNIWKLPLSGTGMQPITKFTSGDMFAFAWSKDGKQLAFSRGQNKTDVVMMSGFH